MKWTSRWDSRSAARCQKVLQALSRPAVAPPLAAVPLEVLDFAEEVFDLLIQLVRHGTASTSSVTGRVPRASPARSGRAPATAPWRLYPHDVSRLHREYRLAGQPPPPAAPL